MLILKLSIDRENIMAPSYLPDYVWDKGFAIVGAGILCICSLKSKTQSDGQIFNVFQWPRCLPSSSRELRIFDQYSAPQKPLFAFAWIAQPQPLANINIHYLWMDTCKYSRYSLLMVFSIYILGRLLPLAALINVERGFFWWAHCPSLLWLYWLLPVHNGIKRMLFGVARLFFPIIRCGLYNIVYGP